MIDACKKAGVKLQIGYRCQYDPYHRELMRLSQEKVYGDVKVIRTAMSFYGVNGDNWRFTNKSPLGGWPHDGYRRLLHPGSPIYDGRGTCGHYRQDL